MRDIQFICSQGDDLVRALTDARSIFTSNFSYCEEDIKVIGFQIVAVMIPPKIQGGAGRMLYTVTMGFIGENNIELIPYQELKKKSVPE